MKRQDAFTFFFEHAGYSVHPEKEGEIAGRVRGALQMARDEFLAWDAGTTFEWSEDEHGDSSDWSDEQPAYAQWCCIARDSAGESCAALGGIDFGRGVEPWGQPYKRVVEAELAGEALHEAARAELAT